MSTEMLVRSHSAGLDNTIKIDQSDFSKTVLFESSPGRSFQLVLKRVADLLLAIIGIIIISPMLIAIALLVRFSSPGPIIYKSLRVGKDYQPIHMYKFRTMVQDADQQWSRIRKEMNLQGGLFKLKNDTRVTPLGKFLRKYSLDEFPQLFNVVKGEMSLVGPRPFVPKESKSFEYPYTSRFSIIPGMTGPWQVSGRSDLTFDQLCNLELNYVQRWSLWTDIVILFKTVPCVLLKKGAY